MKLSPNFHLSEFEASDSAARAGIDNAAPEEIIHLLAVLCDELLEPIRLRFGPIHISSGYRCPALNTLVKGSDRSQHCKGEAADIVIPGIAPLKVCETILEMGLGFHQLIHEFGRWTHISIAPDRVVPRRQCLTIDRLGTRPGLHPARS